MIKKSVLSLVALAGLGLASPASFALVLSSGSATDTFSWSYDTGSSVLSGNGSITASGFGTNTLSLFITLNNTSSIGGSGGERLVGFGFGIDPNATSVTFYDTADGGMRAASFVTTGALVSNVPGVEICAWGGSNCSGGSNGGIWAGRSDAFTVALGRSSDMGGWGSSVTIDPIGLRYQTGYGSFTFNTPGNSVPEPGPTALMTLGLLGFWLRRRLARTSNGGSAA